MSHPLNASRAFHRFSIAVVFVTILLVWWGTATTTKVAGMAFSDWPLSMGSVNPPGWLQHAAPFLEHSHRLLATLVWWMTFALFALCFVRSWKAALGLFGILGWLMLIIGLFIIAGAERHDASRKMVFFVLGSVVLGGAVAAFVAGWRSPEWTNFTRLSGLALLLVTAQAVLGGLRVTEISDLLAAFHGCVAQVFFCVLLLIVFLSSPRWFPAAKKLACAEISRPRLISALLVGAVFLQLIFGAAMRHHHRSGLADTGLFLTGGQWLPPADSTILLLMFLHKYWALVVLAIAGWLMTTVRKGKDSLAPLVSHSRWIAGLVAAQLVLGALVILTGKHFWMTNFHVINGHLVLGLSFAFAARCWQAKRLRQSTALPAAAA